MKRSSMLGVGALLVTAACWRTARVETGAGDVQPAVPRNRLYLPVGTTIIGQLNQPIGTATSHEGDTFTITTVEPVLAQNGTTVVPAGSTITGHVTGLHSATLPGDQSVIRLSFDQLHTRSTDYPFAAEVVSVVVQKQSTTPSSSSTTRSAVTGAAAGAVLGAVVGGLDLKKILEGGILGAAAGTVISLGTGGSESVIPAGSSVGIRSTQSVMFRQSVP